MQGYARFVPRGSATLTTSPTRAVLLSALAAYAAMTVVFLTIGFLLTKVVLHGSVGRWDEHAEVWLAHHRTVGLNQITRFASWMADAPQILAVAVPASVVLAIKRRWHDLLIIAIGLPLELAVFLSVTFPVGRDRPSVHKLNTEPSTGSFPSGHITATIVLYCGIALILDRRIQAWAGRVVLWVIAVAMPLVVGFARADRGMHHPTDVAAGAVLGIACLVLADRAAGRAFPLVQEADDVDESPMVRAAA